jgi:hypothetical protein
MKTRSRRRRSRRRVQETPSKAEEVFAGLSIKAKRKLAVLRGEAVRERRKHMDDDYTRSIRSQIHGKLGANGYKKYQSGNLGTEHVHGIRWPRGKTKKRVLDDNALNYRQTVTGYKNHSGS